MAIGTLVLADQPKVFRSSFLSGLADWGHHCSKALDASRRQHEQSDAFQSATEPPSAATPPLQSTERLTSSPSNAAPRRGSPSSGGKGTPEQHHSQSKSGQSRSKTQKSVRWSNSSGSGISAPGGRQRRPVSTLMLATIPHASYLMAEPSPPPLVSLSMISDTVRHICAGTAARTMAQAFIHPIDTIKTRLQVRTPEGLLKTWRKSTRQYPFDFQVGGRRILQTRNVLVAGPRDVYLGFTGAVLGTIPTAFIYFTVYEWSKRQLEKRGWSSAAGHIGSASAGAVMSALVRVPTDTLKHQVQAYLHGDVFQAARTICRTSGVPGLYRGFWPTLARDVPEIAIQFTLYERLRKMVEQRQDTQRLRTWQHLLLGGISGAVAASVTMPLDYIKTATQCGSPMGAKELVRLTLREKGVRGLFAGMVPRVTQTAIMSAMFFTLFEMWKAALKRDRAPEDSRLNTKMWRKRRDHVWKRQFVLE